MPLRGEHRRDVPGLYGDDLTGLESNANGLGEDVDISHLTGSVRCDDAFSELGQELSLRAIQRVFIGQATEQSSTESADALRVEDQALLLGHLDADRRELPQERRAAELESAWRDAAEHLRGITDADLSKLDAPLCGGGHATVELAKVDPLLAREEDHDLAARLRLRPDDLDGKLQRAGHMPRDAKHLLLATLAAWLGGDLIAMDSACDAREPTTHHLATVALHHHSRSRSTAITLDPNDLAALEDAVARVVDSGSIGAVASHDDGVVERAIAVRLIDVRCPRCDVDGGLLVDVSLAVGREKDRGAWFARL